MLHTKLYMKLYTLLYTKVYTKLYTLPYTGTILCTDLYTILHIVDPLLVSRYYPGSPWGDKPPEETVASGASRGTCTSACLLRWAAICEV